MAIRKSSNKKTKASKKVTKASGILSLKTRNAGTMTESAFWSFIRSSLRQKSRWWKPITQAKDAAKRKYKGPNKRQKWEYLCNVCNNYFPNTEINVDHIIPAGTLRSAQDLPGFVERLFCEVDNLQVLCNVCHNKKTQDEKSKK
jgi:5-methylcytosine-specific restriction endonuclease McrA